MRVKEKARVRAKEGAVVRAKQEIVAVGQEAAVRAIPLYPHWVLGADHQQFLREHAGQGKWLGGHHHHPQGQ